MLKRLKAIFAWRLVKSVSSVNWYYENDVTGDRKVLISRGCFSPINWDWLEGGTGRALYPDRFGDWVDAKEE